LSDRPIAERYAKLQMNIRDRNESPRVSLREYCCPSCAASLTVDVVTEGLHPLSAAKVRLGAGVGG
jgi:hypothetical protein